MSRLLVPLLALLALFAVSAPAAGKDPAKSAQDPAFRSGASELVVLPVVVTDKQGRYISDLPGDKFSVYDNDVIEIARTLRPSERGELEITDVNRHYLRRGKLDVKLIGRGMAWLDTGTHEALLDASMFIETIEKRQGLKVSCPEEIAYRMGFIDAAALESLAASMQGNAYGSYLLDVLREAPR